MKYSAVLSYNRRPAAIGLTQWIVNCIGQRCEYTWKFRAMLTSAQRLAATVTLGSDRSTATRSSEPKLSLPRRGELHMKNLFNRFAKDEFGATAIEYGLIACLISVVCIAIWKSVGWQPADHLHLGQQRSQVIPRHDRKVVCGSPGPGPGLSFLTAARLTFASKRSHPAARAAATLLCRPSPRTVVTDALAASRLPDHHHLFRRLGPPPDDHLEPRLARPGARLLRHGGRRPACRSRPSAGMSPPGPRPRHHLLLLRLGWIGGGDAKIAAATALWFGFDQLFPYLAVASLLGGLLTLACSRPAPIRCRGSPRASPGSCACTPGDRHPLRHRPRGRRAPRLSRDHLDGPRLLDVERRP